MNLNVSCHHIDNKRSRNGLLSALCIFVLVVQMMFVFLYAPNLFVSSESISTIQSGSAVAVPVGFTPPIVAAQFAILMDMETGQILYKKNENTRAFPASITKIMTGLLATERLKEDDIITMSHDAVYSIERDSSHIALQVGEQITMSQALHALLLVSANDAANGIAERVSGTLPAFAADMTKRAIEIGTKDTNFNNAHGLPDEIHYTTAYDMAIITREAMKNPTFRKYFTEIQYTMEPTNLQKEKRYFLTHHKMLYNTRYHYEPAFAGKTGYTSKAGSTLVTVGKKDGHELICVTLKESAVEAYADAKILLEFGFNKFEPLVIDEGSYNEKIIKVYDNQNEMGTAKFLQSPNNTIWIPKGSLATNADLEINIPETMQKNTKDENVIIKIAIPALTTNFYEASAALMLKTSIIPNPTATSAPSSLAANNTKDNALMAAKIAGIVITSLIVIYLLYVLFMIFYTGYHRKLLRKINKKLRKHNGKIKTCNNHSKNNYIKFDRHINHSNHKHSNAYENERENEHKNVHKNKYKNESENINTDEYENERQQPREVRKFNVPKE